MTVGEAVRKLRLSLDESQQAFAHRLQAAIRTVARWEAGHKPNSRMLSQLERVAREHGLNDYAVVFRAALSADVGTELSVVPEFDPVINTPKTIEEKILVHSLLLAVRQPSYAKLAASVRRLLKPITDDVQDLLETAEVNDRVEAAAELLLSQQVSPEEIAAKLRLNCDWVEWKRKQISEKSHGTKAKHQAQS